MMCGRTCIGDAICVSAARLCPQGLKRDVLLCFDLKVPPEFIPTNNDGEVDEFFLWPLPRVAEVRAGRDA